jgi:hypothetical protein
MVSYTKNALIKCREDLWGCGMMKIPHGIESSLTDGGEFITITHRLSSIAKKNVYLFLWYSA